jgi:endonuclease/exonuclease/phosphatase family metal-dependent hydrolase
MRVVSWNIHGCVGADGRFWPERVARVLARLRPDLVLLQEVGDCRGRQDQPDQARLLARELGMTCAVGITIEAGPHGYGVATLCRTALVEAETFDLSVHGFEPRACLRVVVPIGVIRLTLLNVHLGLAFGERRLQLERMLAESGPLGRPPAPFLLAGDFNDWPPGPVTQLLGRRWVDVAARAGRTFPSLCALTRLDRVYVGRGLRPVAARVERGLAARLASDHLPVVVDVDLVPSEAESLLQSPSSPAPPPARSRSSVR